MNIVSVAQMRELERAAFASGVSEAQLQEQAGAAVAEETAPLLDRGGSVVILAGRGNNGRDGAVAARHLARRGYHVDLLLDPGHTVREDELGQLGTLGAWCSVIQLPDDLLLALGHAQVVVDGLLGIGATGPMREPMASWVRLVNRVRSERGPSLAVLAIDIPSGIDADSGAILGEAIRADHTVTLGTVKGGLLQFPAAELVGNLIHRALSIPPEWLEAVPFRLLTEDQVAPLVPPRPADSHKYHYGRVLAVAGSPHYPGAAVLCTAASARAGAGLVTLLAEASVRQAVTVRVPEVTYVASDADPLGDPEAALTAVERRLEHPCTLVVGPGLGRAPSTVSFVRAVLRARRGRPESVARAGLVLDADGIFALSGWPRWWESLGSQAILTPHAGELARLDEQGPSPGATPPWERASTLSRRWGCVLIAKGSTTVVASPDGRAEVWPYANSALATAGTGDVLAGVCGGLLAQGLTAWDAARLAVVIHARAARAVVRREGWRSILASDLLPEIPRELARLASKLQATPGTDA